MRNAIFLALLGFSQFLGSAVAAPSDADIQKAVDNVRWAWNDHGPCSRLRLCATYFDAFGLNIKFDDGAVVPFAHVQRLTTSAHDCIQKAKDALRDGNRGLAVEWTIASQIHNKDLMKWYAAHPDAVIAAVLTVN